MKNRFACLIIISAIALVVIGIATVRGASVTPTLIPNFHAGNAANECAQTECVCVYACKYTPGGGWEPSLPAGVSISITLSTDETSFDWTANVPICCVIVKGGTDAWYYKYNGGATSDTGLTAPTNPGGNTPEVSHATFCWGCPPDNNIPDVPLGTITATVAIMAAFGAYLTLRKSKSITI
ncbi:MAG: hypothetical protein QW674_05490 [Candidatus Bathyarchaeia archaeon]